MPPKDRGIWSISPSRGSLALNVGKKQKGAKQAYVTDLRVQVYASICIDAHMQLYLLTHISPTLTL